MQDQQPQHARDLDDARIGEELGEVAAHRRRGRRVGRAEIDEQHADAGRAVVGKRRCGCEGHVRPEGAWIGGRRGRAAPDESGAGDESPGPHAACPGRSRRRGRAGPGGARRCCTSGVQPSSAPFDAQRHPAPAPQVEAVDVGRDPPVAEGERGVDDVVHRASGAPRTCSAAPSAPTPRGRRRGRRASRAPGPRRARRASPTSRRPRCRRGRRRDRGTSRRAHSTPPSPRRRAARTPRRSRRSAARWDASRARA